MTFRNHALGLLLTATIPAVTAVPAFAQDAAAPSRPAQTESVDSLIEQLGADEYATRKAATQKLRALGEKARADLEHAVEDHDDAEVKMRAQRILRRIEAGGAQGRGEGLRRSERRGPFRGQTLRGTAESGDIRELIEEMLDERMPSSDAILERVLEQVHGEAGEGLRGRLIPDGFFQFERGGSPHFFGRSRVDVDDDAQSEAESYRVEVGENGVRVEVEVDEDGESEAEVYEAPDMESFREQHPDLAERFFGDGKRAFELRTGKGPGVLRWHSPQQPFGVAPPSAPRFFQNSPFSTDDNVPPPSQRLGVVVGALHPAVADFLGFEAGTGLRIDRVQDGTLADNLGVRVGDVLMKVAGQSIAGRADVAKALAGVEFGEEVEVVLNRRGHQLELRAEKPVVGDEEHDDEDEEEVEHERDEDEHEDHEEDRESVLRKR